MLVVTFQQTHPAYNLVGLTGWWRWLENEGEKELKRRDKEVALLEVENTIKRKEM